MRETLKKLRDTLRPIYGNTETEAIIRLIFLHLKGWSPVDIIMHENQPLSLFIKSQVDEILRRLLAHEPIQYITGTAYFHGLDLIVRPGVLIPRPETSQLVDIIADDAGNTPDFRVLDLCTGSGCIADALARTLDFPSVTAVDISSTAIEVAKENARLLKVPVNVLKADILSQDIPGTFDIIVSNPPYVDESEKKTIDRNVIDYEPHLALFVPDSDPLIFYRRINQIALSHLSSGGRLYYEINPRHAAQLAAMTKADGFSDVEILRDAFGKERFLRASKT